MEPAIKAQYTLAILDEAVERFGLARSQVDALDGFESFIYRGEQAGRPCILRISHRLHRDAQAIAGEIEWVNYLADNEVNACRALPSRNGNLTERLGDRDMFAAVLFEMAPGTHTRAEDWQPPLFETVGQMMGRMHALTKAYVPSDPAIRRPEWYEDISGWAEKYIPDQPLIIDKFNANIAATQALDQNQDCYGLVHFDFHRGNFFVDNGRIYLFDFDDCQYAWFADDIAICLFYAVPHDCSSAEDLAFARTFMHHFLDGYYRENTLDQSWLTHIPLFLKRRELDLYTIIHRSNPDLSQLDPWSASFMAGRADKLANDVPYIDIDFSAL